MQIVEGVVERRQKVLPQHAVHSSAHPPEIGRRQHRRKNAVARRFADRVRPRRTTGRMDCPVADMISAFAISMEAKALSQRVADGRVARAGVHEEPERTRAIDPGGHHNRPVLVGVETNEPAASPGVTAGEAAAKQ